MEAELIEILWVEIMGRHKKCALMELPAYSVTLSARAEKHIIEIYLLNNVGRQSATL